MFFFWGKTKREKVSERELSLINQNGQRYYSKSSKDPLKFQIDFFIFCFFVFPFFLFNVNEDYDMWMLKRLPRERHFSLVDFSLVPQFPS